MGPQIPQALKGRFPHSEPPGSPAGSKPGSKQEPGTSKPSRSPGWVFYGVILSGGSSPWQGCLARVMLQPRCNYFY